MSKVVCIDSTILIWGVKKYASPGQENKIPQAVRFIEQLDESDTKILIPTPIITELLSHKATESERDAVIVLLNTKNIIIKPFDIACALKCGELLQKTFTDKELRDYAIEEKIVKAKIKYDSMIAATAIVNKCDCIYAEDGDIERYAGGQIRVLKMPTINVQTDLFGQPLRPPR